MRKRSAALLYVGGAGILKTEMAVRTTANDVRVVVVLAVVLPTALPASLVSPALRERDVPTAGAGVRPARL